ncbi:Rmf/CrpP family protein [Enterovirga aerilata]|uniref:Rmf/CrpP family protein n=1 Tax=Enterovirga aerilata TaxID=2730920 RepID=UPI003D297840
MAPRRRRAPISFGPSTALTADGHHLQNEVNAAACPGRRKPIPSRAVYDILTYLNEGAEAGLDGLSVERCPYLAGSRKGGLWIRGFVCAEAGPAVPFPTSSPRSASAAERAPRVRPPKLS